MTISGGRLSLVQRDHTQHPPMPVDDLLHSLALDAGGQAIGVILSGTGSDGALGMQAIKAEGGLTFAQDETSARFSAMPRAAVDLGCVDSVLPPPALAQALARIARHPRTRPPPAIDGGAQTGDDDDGMKRMFRILHKVCKVDFGDYKRGTLDRRLERRMVLRQVPTLTAYFDMLETEPGEAQAVCCDFLINVTSFFREPESFADLTRIVWPQLLEGRTPGVPLRIWVPGCASGEEVYSVAMSALEYLGDRGDATRIQIFGSDVSEAAIATARAGLYIENIERDVSPERIRRFFFKVNSHYQVTKQVRDLCIFCRHDVTRDPPFSHIDLVSCRNLLIYLAPEVQKRLMPVFHFALNPSGCLLLGAAESVGMSSHLFRPIEHAKAKLYVRKATIGRSSVSTAEGKPAPRPFEPSADTPRAQAGESEQMQRKADRIALSRFAPPVRRPCGSVAGGWIGPSTASSCSRSRT